MRCNRLILDVRGVVNGRIEVYIDCGKMRAIEQVMKQLNNIGSCDWYSAAFAENAHDVPVDQIWHSRFYV